MLKAIFDTALFKDSFYLISCLPDILFYEANWTNFFEILIIPLT